MGNIFFILTRQTFNRREEVKNEVQNILLNWSGAASYFKSRSESLTNIHQHITSNKIVIIHGVPGIGKTETARYYANQHSEYFAGNLILIPAETEEKIKKCFKDLSDILNLKITDVSLVYSKFSSSRCLFVFDDAMNMETIGKYLPPAHLHETVKIIITSQYSQWELSDCTKVSLEPLNLIDALEIFEHKLEKKYHQSMDEIFKDLAEYLEGIPLSIQIVSSIINQEFRTAPIDHSDLEKFIDGLKYKFINLEFPDFAANVYNKSVLSSITSVLSRLNDENSQFSDLLCYMAYLDPDYISYKDLLFLPSMKGSEEILRTVLNKLEDYSLIQRKYDSKNRLKIQIHRTIRLVFRNFDLRERHGAIFKIVLKAILLNQMFVHIDSILGFIMEENLEKIVMEFYYENTAIANSYLFALNHFQCDVLLQKIISIFEKVKRDNNASSDFLVATFVNDIKSIELLIIYGPTSNFSIKITDSGIQLNIYHGSICLSVTKTLYSSLESNDSESRNPRDFEMYRRIILHLLVQLCNHDNIKETIKSMDNLIFEMNEKIFIRHENENTILHTACRKSNICFQMIEYLLNNPSCKHLINSQNKWDETPLHVLFQYNYQHPELYEIVTHFITKCKADITIQDNKHWNIFFYICRYGTAIIIELVLKSRNCQQFINHQDLEGNFAFTQLIYNESITEQEKIDFIDLFILNNMNFNAKNNENQSLQEIAEENGLSTLSDELEMESKSGFFYKNSCIIM